MSGQRIHYSHPTIELDERGKKHVSTIFKIKQRIPKTLVEEVAAAEIGKSPTVQETDKYMDRLCESIKDYTMDKQHVPIGQRVSHMWPTGPHEEWLDSVHDKHWMTGQWFTGSDNGHLDYALLLTVKAPIDNISPEEYEKAWGEAFVLTKLGMYE